ncbi:hypothetical protein QQF64_034705 [Cirrhinus molitorella]|uniref:Uncharacterized protein n=1 Tax=Cirrhinus molitorella TaxID=172907 RepID=A0ABR3L593_9TELE
MVRGAVFPLSNQADEDEVIVFTVHMSLSLAFTSCSHRDGGTKEGSMLQPGGVLVGERIMNDRVMGGGGRTKGQSSSKLWGDWTKQRKTERRSQARPMSDGV